MFEHLSVCVRKGTHLFQYFHEGKSREIWDPFPDARKCVDCGYWQIKPEGGEAWLTMTPEERVAYELMYGEAMRCG